MSSSELFKNLQARMQILGIEPKRSLGQNFLISPEVVEKIIACAKKFDPQQIVEVGPGLGTLTDPLRELRRPYFLIEMDRKLAEFWKTQGLEVFVEDALQFNWQQFPVSEKFLLVSNLPYQISSSLLIERSIDERPLNGMILMFQKEVAQRIMAQPKTSEYGMLTVIAQMTWEIRKLADASPRDFFPAPNVASRVLFFQLKKELPPQRARMLRLVKAAFSHRRKKLFNNLIGQLGITPEKLSAIWEQLHFSDNCRAEELSVSHYIDLFKLIN